MISNTFTKKVCFLIVITFSMIGITFAANSSVIYMRSAKKIIPHLKQTLKSAKLKTTLPIVFPKKIPVNAKAKTYYIYFKLTNNGYLISVDSTKMCHGVKVCNIGSIQAKTYGKISTYYDMNKNKLTIPVTLKDHKTGYFTPSHAMGDFWPANLQWKKHQTLYTIKWTVSQAHEKAALIHMANEMI